MFVWLNVLLYPVQLYIHDLSAALTWWDEQSLSLLQSTFITLVHLVSKEHFTVIWRWSPPLVQRQVGRGGLDEEEDLLSLQTQTPLLFLASQSYERWTLTYFTFPFKNHFRIEDNQYCTLIRDRWHWLSRTYFCSKASSDSTHWSNHKNDRPLGCGTRRRHHRTQCGNLCSCLWRRWDSIWWLLVSQAERHQASSFLPMTTAAQSVDSPLYCSSCLRKTHTDYKQKISTGANFMNQISLYSNFMIS